MIHLNCKIWSQFTPIHFKLLLLKRSNISEIKKLHWEHISRSDVGHSPNSDK